MLHGVIHIYSILNKIVAYLVIVSKYQIQGANTPYRIKACQKVNKSQNQWSNLDKVVQPST